MSSNQIACAPRTHARARHCGKRFGVACCAALLAPLGAWGQAPAPVPQVAAEPLYFVAQGGRDSRAGAFAEGPESLAAGEASQAVGRGATAFGAGATAIAERAVALGHDAWARDPLSVALGTSAKVEAAYTAALGPMARVLGTQSVAAGYRSQTGEDGASAFGSYSEAKGRLTAAFGYGTRAEGRGALALGNYARAAASDSVAQGTDSLALGKRSISVGANSRAEATDTLALGRGAVAAAVDSVAVGSGSRAEAGAVVSFGSGDGVGGPAARRLVNVEAGAVAADSRQAVNGSQLFAAMQKTLTWLGGATDPQGGMPSPGYWVRGAIYDNVGGAIGALDQRMGDIDAGVRSANTLGVGASAAGADAVAVGRDAHAQAGAGTALGAGSRVASSATGAVALGQSSVADRANTVSVGSAGAERQVTNVAAGTQDTDAVNKAQLDGGVTRANAYTDQRYSAMADTFQTYQGEVDDRFRRQDKRIDQQGAMSAAMLNMATSAAGIRTQNRLGVGVGFQSGESALSLGYQRAISDRATVTVGGAFSSDDSSVGVGAGFGW
jgi:autotransporter adhesin